MANRIVGLDIGTWAVKAVIIDLERDIEVVGYREIRLEELDTGPVTGTDGTVDEMPPGPGQEPAEGKEEAGFGAADQADGDDWGGDGEADDWADAPASDEPGDHPWSDAGADSDGEGVDGPSQWSSPEELVSSWSMAISKLVHQGFFEGVNRVITSFPDDESVILHLEVPFERESEVEEVLPHLLQDELPIALDEIIYDFVVIPGTEVGSWEALLGFVERQKMADFLDECQTAGIDPAVVGVPELMLRYAGEQAASPGVDHYGIIDIGHRVTRLLIMSEGKPVVAHTARRGGRGVTEALAENFQIPTDEARQLKHDEGIVGDAARGGDRRVQKVRGTIEEALRPIVREVRRTFQSAYAKYDVAVDEIYLCGGTSRLQGLTDYLEGEFEVDVMPLDVGRGVDWRVGAADRDRQPEAALALASALQQPLDEGQKRLLDFRKEEFVYRGKSSYLRTKLVRLGAVAAVLVVMLAGVLLMQRYDQQAQLEAMERAVIEETSELFGESVTDPTEVQSRLEGEGMADRGFVPEMSAYELKVRIIERIPDSGDDAIPLELDRLEVDVDRSLIQMIGKTDSAQSVESIATHIEGLECLDDVSQEQVSIEGDDQVHFELRIASGCS